LSGALYYYYSEKTVNNPNSVATPQGPPIPPPPTKIEIDYSKISDPDIRSLFQELEMEFETSNLINEHVLTVFEKDQKREYVQHSITYGDFSNPYQKLNLEGHMQNVKRIDAFFRSRGFVLNVDYINQGTWTRFYVNKLDLGCTSDITEFPLSVLICQKQVPDWNEITSPFYEVVYEDFSTSDIAVRYIFRNYARGSMRRSGQDRNWLAIKQNGKWNKITEARGLEFDCSLIDQYRIPREIYGNCIEDQFNMRHK